MSIFWRFLAAVFFFFFLLFCLSLFLHNSLRDIFLVEICSEDYWFEIAKIILKCSHFWLTYVVNMCTVCSQFVKNLFLRNIQPTLYAFIFAIKEAVIFTVIFLNLINKMHACNLHDLSKFKMKKTFIHFMS